MSERSHFSFFSKRTQGKIQREDGGASAAPRKRESLLVLCVSGVVVGVILAGLWISATAIIEKVRLANGLRQIIDVVSVAREAAAFDSALGASGREDMMLALQKLGRFTPDGEIDGVKTARNPWGGILTALALPGGIMRVQTIVPTHACQRVIDVFGQNPQALGLRQIEVKGWQESWRQVYVEGSRGKVSEEEIAAGCSNTVQANVALTFSLR